MKEIKECMGCEHFARMSDWQTTAYAEIIQQDDGTGFKDGKPVISNTIGQQNPILNEMAKNGAGFGKVYTVCRKHKIILPANQASQCPDYEKKEEQPCRQKE